MTTKERLPLARIMAEAIELLAELEGYLAVPLEKSEIERVNQYVLPRLAQLRRLMN